MTKGNLNKSEFPSLLKKLIHDLEHSSKQNLISGFGKCGIQLPSVDTLLSRLPNTNVDDPQGPIEDAFLKSLAEQRKSCTDTGKKPRPKAIGLQVQAGKSISLH